MITFLIRSTAERCSGLQTNSLVFLVRLQRRAAMEAKLGMKRLKNWTIPRNVCKLARLVEGSIDSMDSIFRGSGCKPSAPIMWPKNGIRAHLNLHLSRLKRRPVSRARCKTARRLLSWSRSSYPYTTMSFAIPVTPGKSPRVSSTFLSKLSWAQIKPKGQRRSLYLPKGELKVVNSKLSWSSLMSQ